MNRSIETAPSIHTVILPAGDPESITRAAEMLRAGELVAFPTDTVYGVGALYSDNAAVERLYFAKVRPENKGIPILLAGAADLALVAGEINQLALNLAAAFWPGPLTLILPKGPAVPPAVSQTGTIAVRAPGHPVALALIQAAGVPLATTSANLSGSPPTADPSVVCQTLGGRIAAIIDGGLAPGGTPSTIVDCTVDPPKILRPGPISEDEIMKAAGLKGNTTC